jgi:glycosyltransferase involved in cell wall biosynthesis
MSPNAVPVVIPTYNRVHLIARSVRSTIQSCRDADEIIVVALPRGGLGKARNHGIRGARHPLTAFLDSDNEWKTGCLERVWGADPVHLAAHAGEFRAVCTRQEHFVIRALRRQERLREAREILSRREPAPLSWKMLAPLPNSLVRHGIRARTVRRRAKQVI